MPILIAGDLRSGHHGPIQVTKSIICLQLCHTQFFSPVSKNELREITLYQASGNDHRDKISH